MSTLRTNTLQDAAGNNSVPMATVAAGTAKAWVNFNGTGTVAIRASFNVTSITDNGVGDYTVNYTSALTDANYAFAVSAVDNGTNFTTFAANANFSATTTAMRFNTRNSGGIVSDTTNVCVAVYR